MNRFKCSDDTKDYGVSEVLCSASALPGQEIAVRCSSACWTTSRGGIAYAGMKFRGSMKAKKFGSKMPDCPSLWIGIPLPPTSSVPDASWRDCSPCVTPVSLSGQLGASRGRRTTAVCPSPKGICNILTPALSLSDSAVVLPPVVTTTLSALLSSGNRATMKMLSVRPSHDLLRASGSSEGTFAMGSWRLHQKMTSEVMVGAVPLLYLYSGRA